MILSKPTRRKFSVEALFSRNRKETEDKLSMKREAGRWNDCGFSRWYNRVDRKGFFAAIGFHSFSFGNRLAVTCK